jgi:Protein of unknown function (DUF2997)
MAEYQKIEYRIGKDGVVSETVLDGQGQSCILATETLEQALGQVESRELLPEYEGDHDNALTVEQTQTMQVQE